jgi:hypothetical protein
MNTLLQDIRYALRQLFLPAAAILLCLSSSTGAQTAPGPAPASSKVKEDVRPPAQRGEGYKQFDSDLPGLEPKVFAKNLLYGDHGYPGYQTFDETGEEFYYAVTDREWQSSRIRHISAKDPSKIDTLLLTNDKWEGEPFITYDGSRMFFTAILPPTDHPWQSDLYYVDKTAAGWSTPHLLPPPVNTLASEWHASLTREGVLYFCSERDGGRLRGNIFRAVPENGTYPKVEKLPSPINTEYNDCDPLIAPDESYLIFHSNRPGGFGEHDLYSSFRDARGQWSAPRNMGPSINTPAWEMAPSLSPDGKFLFFTRRKAFVTDEPSQIFWVSIKIIEQFRP